MKYYVVLDVSLSSISVCVVDEEGAFIREKEVCPEPDSLVGFLNSLSLPYERIGLETGSTSSWLYKNLQEAGFPIICIESRHAAAIMKAQHVKTDRNDARGIAQIMRTGWFKSVHIKSNESQEMRVLINNRKCLLQQRLNLENQIRGTLKIFGLKIGSTTPHLYESRVLDLLQENERILTYVKPLLEARRVLWEQSQILDTYVKSLTREDELCRRFMQIPGIGPLTSLLYKSTVDHPHRFKKSSTVGVYPSN